MVACTGILAVMETPQIAGVDGGPGAPILLPKMALDTGCKYDNAHSQNVGVGE